MIPRHAFRRLAVLVAVASCSPAPAADPKPLAGADAIPLIGYTELRTNLPGGRHANVRTMRAAVVRPDGTDRRLVAEELAKEPDTWTQFAGWSPDGKAAIIGAGWQLPENAKWEEENKRFRMDEGKWKLDSCLLDLASGKVTNVTAVDRVSHYNGGLFFLPDGRGLGFTPLIKGVSKPYLMDPDGRNKRDVSGKGAGFAYGYSASPDGKSICYHENYQLYVSDADGADKKHIKTGNPFDFGPTWSPDGKWLLFVSGEHYNCHPHVVRADGTGLKKLADRGGYRGVTEFLDVFDFHGGSSDLPVWAVDGASVYFTAKSRQVRGVISDDARREGHPAHHVGRRLVPLPPAAVAGRKVARLRVDAERGPQPLRQELIRRNREAAHRSETRFRRHVAALAPATPRTEENRTRQRVASRCFGTNLQRWCSVSERAATARERCPFAARAAPTLRCSLGCAGRTAPLRSRLVQTRYTETDITLSLLTERDRVAAPHAPPTQRHITSVRITYLRPSATGAPRW